jgi:hypothetical protein
MARDGKRQAGAAGFLRHRSMTPCQNFCERLTAALLLPQLRVFHGGKPVD